VEVEPHCEILIHEFPWKDKHRWLEADWTGRRVSQPDEHRAMKFTISRASK